MDYKRFDNVIFARFDRGEEILDCLKKVATKENIKLAHINALGATDEVIAGAYNPITKVYHSNTFTGDYEIVSLHGTITTKDGEYYPHLHISIADEQGRAFGGHLNKCVISATCELVITVFDGCRVDRSLDSNVGLNVFKF